MSTPASHATPDKPAAKKDQVQFPESSLVAYADTDTESEAESENDKPPRPATIKELDDLKDRVGPDSYLLEDKPDNDDPLWFIRPRVKDSSDLPALPKNFYNQYVSSVRYKKKDDPSLHDGRLRDQPHLNGWWPSHCFVEWVPNDVELRKLQTMMHCLQLDSAFANFKLHSLLTNDLGAVQPLHISLSRTFGMLLIEKMAFREIFLNGINKHRLYPFTVSFSGLDWWSNAQATRWFLVLKLKKPVDEALTKLLAVSDTAVKVLIVGGHGAYEEEQEVVPMVGPGQLTPATEYVPQFHVSIAWTLEKPPDAVIERTRSGEGWALAAKFLGRTSVTFDTVKIKMGKEATEVRLLPPPVDGGFMES